MRGQIFISYRRDDSKHAAGRLFGHLAQKFPTSRIFMDIDKIDPGEKFAEVIKERVESCQILIAVIGPHWLDARDADGKRRLDNPEDFVRLEVSAALERGIRVMPVLVDDAEIPKSTQLPPDLQGIIGRQAVELSHNRFATDAELIIGAINRAFEKAAAAAAEKGRLEAKQREKRRLEALGKLAAGVQERFANQQREREEKNRQKAEQRDKERLEAKQRENERLEAEQREKERLEAERSRQIFVSYRREESRRSARSLYDRLCRDFDPKKIFMDINAIALGDDFLKAIEKTVGECDVLIAVIGNNWLTSKDDHGNRKLDNSEDFVRIEIATALKRGIRVIPVLVGGASMPSENDLPEDLKPLVRRIALAITDTTFDGDCQQLAAAIWGAWRAELVSKSPIQRTIRVSLSNDVHFIEFLLTRAVLHAQAIKVDGVVVAKAGSVMTWEEKLVFRIYDGDIEYTAVIESKPPVAQQLRMCRLLVDGRLMYTD